MDVPAFPAELAQQILSVRVTRFRRRCEPGQGFRNVFLFQKFLRQTVCGKLVPALSGPCQPVDTLLPVVDFHIIGQQQFTQGVLRVRQLPRRLPEPILCLHRIRREQGAVPVQPAQEKLGMGVAALRLCSEPLHPFITQIQWEAAVTDH